ncbi:MAG: chromate transporter [Alistipes sp.]|nr:chromate transporter [Alistipes sp.]
MIYLQLFISYLKIGFFGFGGGYAMLSLIQNEIVEQRGWITASQFADIVAISQMTPGPIAINSATYIGYTVGGFWGSAVATLAVCLPALTVMLALTKFFLKLKDNRYVAGVLMGMRPVVIGMIAAAALLLIFPKQSTDNSFIDPWSWILFGVTLYASYKKVNPILLIVISAVVGIIIYGVLP